jgi:hypothetical protein
MRTLMALPAKCDEIGLGVIAESTPPYRVVNIKIR